MTAAMVRWWTVPRLNVVIRTHPVLVRAVLQRNLLMQLLNQRLLCTKLKESDELHPLEVVSS